MLKGFVSGEEKDIKRIPMKGKNLFDKSTVIARAYISDLDGSIKYYSGNLNASDYIDVEGFTSIYISSVQSSSWGAFYDTSKAFISGFTGYDRALGVPQNAKYVRITVPSSNLDTLMLNSGSQPLPYEPYGYQEGWEVRDNRDRLIWGREDELQTATGTLPFKGYALPVKVKSLLGNAVQNGTPSPQSIITPEMCGVRTGNLWDGVLNVGYFLDAAFRIDTTATKYRSIRLHLESGKYTFSFEHPIRLVRVIVDNTYYENVAENVTEYTITITNDNYDIGISFRDEQTGVQWDNSPIMLNSGSTPLPYEPYGWKVPFENHGENLWDEDYTGINGNLKYVPVFVGDGTFTMSTDTPDYSRNAPLFLLSGNVASGASTPINGVYNGVSRTVNSSNGYVTIAFRRQSELTDPTTHKTMLNLGSTPKPYSPYLNATIPVYLGEVPTVRRVKKLVLKGDASEQWEYAPVGNLPRFRCTINALAQITQCICSHYKYEFQNADGNIFVNSTLNTITACDSSYTDLEQWKSYLASEYAAGHPVTIWYVLANEQTGISNEPLCKISTYADELTTIQVHGLSAPLYGIGDYKDTLNLSTGVVTRKVKKLVLTGNETFTKNNASTTDYLYYAGRGALLPSSISQTPIACSHLKEFGSSPTGGIIGINTANNFNVVYVNFGADVMNAQTSGNTVDGLKEYLASEYAAGHPVTIWYILSTPTTETVTVPTGMTGEIEGYLTQISTPSPTNRSVPKWNGEEETGGTYAVTVYTPPEIPTTTGQNTLIVDSNLAPSKLEVSIHAKKIHYGFKIDKSNDDSESAVIYTHDAVTMTPVHMDFTNDRFDYGSWGNAFFVRDCYPVALNLDGTIAYRLDPDDYTKKTDGTASDIFYELLTAAPSDWSTQWKQYYTKDANDNYELNSQGSAPTFAQDTYYKLTYNSSFTGNFMMAFPKVWFYRHEDSQYNYIEISNYKLSDDWKCYAHINASGQEVDFIYLPLFKGVIVNSKLRSLPGQIPQGNTTATDEVNAATALGSRWQIWDHSSVECINDLLTLMSKSIDSQGRFGQGRSDGYDSTDTVTYGKLQSGTLIKKGKFHGYSSDYKDVKVFGIEGFWSNRWDRLQGMLLVNNVWKIKMTPPYNFTGTDFVTLSNAVVPSGNGYLSKVQTTEYGSIPASIANGSSTKYFKDYFNKSTTDTRVALRGGLCLDGDYAGFRFVSMDCLVSYSGWTIGASPVYK